LALITPGLLLSPVVLTQSDPIADYTAFRAGNAAVEAGNWPEAVEQLLRIPPHRPLSPLTPRAVLLAARALLELDKPSEAQALIAQHRAVLPEAPALASLAAAAEKTGDRAAAIEHWQRVYYIHSRSAEAADAGAALARLEAPPPPAQMAVARAYRLLEAGEATRARRELTTLLPQLTGAERDLARVRLCRTFTCLAKLEVTSPEADAERLYELVATARRLERDADVVRYANALSRYPSSRWRLRALVAAGNHFLLENDAARAEPFYRACHVDFPSEADASYCHWKLVWYEHMRRGPDAARLMREHIERFPKSGRAGAALYFLGAHAELAVRYPNSYYTTLLRDQPAARAQMPAEWTANQAASIRIERARLLAAGGEAELADEELRFAAKNDEGAQPHVLALEAADIASAAGAPHRGVRTIKALVTDYLLWPADAAPERFWRAAFPLPWRAAVESYSRDRDLDPFVVAALIRQESEWYPEAVSSARAYGLMQVLPSTGRQLGARPASRLFDPDVNLRVGSRHLKTLLDSFDGRWEPTLAAYNAGRRRAVEWLTWGEFREPAEFIETIPFTETRTYVQVVMRNAEIYRRLYSRAEAASN
jgi:soluble lytic murein transglycosylase